MTDEMIRGEPQVSVYRRGHDNWTVGVRFGDYPEYLTCATSHRRPTKKTVARIVASQRVFVDRQLKGAE